MTRPAPMVLLLLALSAASAAAAPAAPTGGSGAASSRVEVLPDADGSSRLRVAHALRLGVDLPRRWRFDVFAAARFGGGFGMSRAVELSGAALRYESPELGLVLGRFAEPGVTGRLLLDGVAARFGERFAVLGGRVWLGHSWHPEAAWTAAPELSGGAELTLRPPGSDGAPGRTIVSLGASMRGAGAGPEIRLRARGDGRLRGGGTWVLGLEGAPTSPEARAGVPLRGVARIDGPRLGMLSGGVEARWEGLPRLGAPLGLPTPQELLAPSGYGVVRGKLGLRVGRLEASLAGGGTVQPKVGVALRAGWLAQGGLSVQLDPRLQLGGLVTGAQMGPSTVVGGGGAATVRLRMLDGTLEGVVLRVRGLNGVAGTVAELRARGVITLPSPGPEGPLVRVSGEIAGGEDRLLVAFIRGGLGIELSGAAGTRRPAR